MSKLQQFLQTGVLPQSATATSPPLESNKNPASDNGSSSHAPRKSTLQPTVVPSSQVSSRIALFNNGVTAATAKAPPALAAAPLRKHFPIVVEAPPPQVKVFDEIPTSSLSLRARLERYKQAAAGVQPAIAAALSPKKLVKRAESSGACVESRAALLSALERFSQDLGKFTLDSSDKVVVRRLQRAVDDAVSQLK